MLTPSWEVSAGALAALLNGSSNTTMDMCELYTITLAGGQVLRYTDSDVAKTIGGRTFVVGPVLKRGRLKRAAGITVDNLSFTLSAPLSLTVNGVPMIQYMVNGGFENARVQLERLYAPAFGAPQGALIKFTGRIAEISGGGYEKTVQVKSDTELLDVMVPRDVYQPGCKNTLYDSACGISRASLTVSGTLASLTQSRTVLRDVGGGGFATGYFDLGVVTFTSGANIGVSRTVRHYVGGAPGTFTLAAPLPFVPVAGDTFTAYPGCDKTQSTCTAKFSNLARFRGEPYIPAPDTVI